MARPVFIIDGSRTPFLKARRGPAPFTPVDIVECLFGPGKQSRQQSDNENQIT
jgi:hypothetical protein